MQIQAILNETEFEADQVQNEADLVKIKPKTKEELIQIKGFGEKKVEKYGDGILEIINR